MALSLSSYRDDHNHNHHYGQKRNHRSHRHDHNHNMPLLLPLDDYFFPHSPFAVSMFENWMPTLNSMEREVLHVGGSSEDDGDTAIVSQLNLSPGYEIDENETEYQILLHVPGYKTSDLDVFLKNKDRFLHVRGVKERKNNKTGQITKTKIAKTFSIWKANVNAKRIEAELISCGLLVLTLPKMQ